MRSTSVLSGTLWNIVGQALPLAVGIFTIPVLVRTLGEDRFGFLTLAWAIVGYFSIFDLGLGRALTQLIASRLRTDAEPEIRSVVAIGSRMLLGLAVFGGVTFALITPWLASTALSTPPDLIQEATVSLYLLALGVPIVVISSGSGGILTAFRRLDILNMWRIPLGIGNYVGPLVIVQFHNGLVAVVASVLVLRVVQWIGLEISARRLLRSLGPQRPMERRTVMGELLGFGGWITVSNFVGPIMVYFDRFLIGGQVSLAAVAYYTTPYMVVTKLWVLSGSLAGATYPKFAAQATKDSHAKLMIDGSLWILFVLLPPTLFIIIFAEDLLTLWLGAEFAKNSALVTQILAAGTLVNAIAQMPFALVQGRGKPKWTAIMHVVELPLYLAGLWFGLQWFGLTGAALAWAIRNAVDCFVLFGMAAILVSPARTYWNSLNFPVIGAACLCLAPMFFDISLGSKIAAYAIATLLTALVAARTIGPKATELLNPLLRRLRYSKV